VGAWWRVAAGHAEGSPQWVAGRRLPWAERVISRVSHGVSRGEPAGWHRGIVDHVP